jgi:hypothetical protein
VDGERRTTAEDALRSGLVDSVVLIALVLSFAALVTAHVALAFGLSLAPPRWRGPVAFVVPPLAPYWGMEAGMKRRAAIWVSALVVYALSRILAEL